MRQVNQLTQELDDYRQRYILRGRLWRNLSLVWDEQSKSKRALEIIYKVPLHRLEQQLQICRTYGRELKLRLQVENSRSKFIAVFKILEPFARNDANNDYARLRPAKKGWYKALFSDF